MKTVKIEKTETTFFLPAKDVLAVYNARATEETRYYLRGVYVEAMAHHDAPETESLFIVATDGNILLLSDLYAGSGGWLGAEADTQANESSRTRGLIIDFDPNEKALKAKASDDLWLYGDTATGIMQVVAYDGCEPKPGLVLDLPRLGVCEFTVIDGTFPDYRRVLPKAKTEGPAACACFDPALLARLVKAGNLLTGLKSAAVMLTQTDAGEPIRVSWGAGAERLTGVLMPCRRL